VPIVHTDERCLPDAKAELISKFKLESEDHFRNSATMTGVDFEERRSG
jgi:hypothetical protein